VLPPGGEGEVKVTLTPKGNHEDIIKRIVVVSNDPKQPRFTLTMKGKLQVDLRAEPHSLNLPEIEPGEPATIGFSLTISDPSTTKIESVELEDRENFELRALPVETEGVVPYELRFLGSKTVGSFGSRVQVKTTGKHTPELNIPIRAAVVSNLRYSKRVHFAKREQEFLARQIRFSTRDGVAPKIKKVEDPDGLLTIEIGEPVNGSVTLDASVDAAKYEALDEGERRKPRKLIVHTDDRHEPKVEISYTVGVAATPTRARPR